MNCKFAFTFNHLEYQTAVNTEIASYARVVYNLCRTVEKKEEMMKMLLKNINKTIKYLKAYYSMFIIAFLLYIYIYIYIYEEFICKNR